MAAAASPSIISTARFKEFNGLSSHLPLSSSSSSRIRFSSYAGKLNQAVPVTASPFSYILIYMFPNVQIIISNRLVCWSINIIEAGIIDNASNFITLSSLYKKTNMKLLSLNTTWNLPDLRELSSCKLGFSNDPLCYHKS